MSAVMRKTLKRCCSVTPGGLDRLRPDGFRRHHNGDIENSLGPTIAASQEGRAMGITHAKYKVAVVQAAPVWIDLEGTVAKTIRYIEEAAKEGAKLIAFPETWIPGYPWYIWVGT